MHNRGKAARAPVSVGALRRIVWNVIAVGLIALCSMLLGPATAGATLTTGQITGKVTKASGGAAIEGIEVCAHEALYATTHARTPKKGRNVGEPTERPERKTRNLRQFETWNLRQFETWIYMLRALSVSCYV